MEIMYDVMELAKTYKWWIAPVAPFVIGFVVVKIVG